MHRPRVIKPLLLAMGLVLAGCGHQSPTKPGMTAGGAGTTDSPHAASSPALTSFALPTAFSQPASIVTGPDQALWVIESGKSGSHTHTGALREFALPAGHTASSLAAGPDGALWFTEPGAGAIGRITTAGAISELTVPGMCQTGYSCPTAPRPTGIVTGSDHALWII